MTGLRQSKQDVVETEYNRDTGEITKQVRSTSYGYKPEEPFIKLYLKHVLIFNDLPPRYAEVLIAMSDFMSYAHDDPPQTVYLNAALKEKICKICGLANVQSLDNSLSELVKANMLYKVTNKETGKTMRGTYQLNPFIVGKGDWKDIVKLRLTIDFDADGKRMLLEERRKTQKSPNQIKGQESMFLLKGDELD